MLLHKDSIQNQRRNSTELEQIFKSASAVLFDMDGVITNTMPRHAKAWIKSFKDCYNINVPKIEIYRREGEKSEKSVREILKKFNCNSEIDNLDLTKFLNYKVNLFSKNIKTVFYPGIRNFIKKLKKHKKIALVTGTQKQEVYKMLSKNFISCFNAVVTSDCIKFGKPNPEPYLKALDLLSIKPDDAIVIENAPYGILSAKSACIKVIALPTSLPESELQKADFVLTHNELYSLL